MRTPQTTIPPLREEVTAKKFGSRIVVEDPVRRVRVPVDQLAIGVLQEIADGPSTPDALVEALGAPRSEVWRRVVMLNAHQLLETPRALAQCQLHQDAMNADAPGDAATATLHWPAGLRHGCVASGGCCHGTDVGPLKPDDIEKIEAIDWSPHLPDDVSRDDWLVETTGPNGETITLLGMRHGRCVFLDSDKLCVVHKVAGSEQKPTICRQFPYTFTRTPRGVDVSYSMECRAWHRARAGGPEPGADEATARRYLAEGGPLLELPSPVALWPGVDVSTEAWLALRDEMLAGVRAATSVGGLAVALASPVRRAFAEHHAAADEPFVKRDAWALPAPDASSQDAVARFLRSCEAVVAGLSEGLDAIREEQLGGRRPEEADRTARVRWALIDFFTGRRLDDLARCPEELDIWRDVALASLNAHEPARRGYLLHGVAKLVLTVLAGHLLSGLLAQTSLRGRTSEQDAVDSVVLLTKMLRGSAFLSLLGRLRGELVELLVDNVEVFATGDAPRSPHPQLHIR